MLKYEFDIEFDVSKYSIHNILWVIILPFEQIAVTYPATAPEVAIPELDGKTAKMYRYRFIVIYDYVYATMHVRTV